MAERQPALVTPFWVRIATETNLSPGWLLIAFPAVLYPTYLLLEVLFGRGLAAATDFEGDWGTWPAPAYAMTLGYIAMMYTYVARGTFRDLEAIRPVLSTGEAALAELRHEFKQFERRRLWVGGVIGFAFGCVLYEIGSGPWLDRISAGQWSLRSVCNFVIFSAFWIVAGRGTVYLIDTARVYSRIGERQVSIDLLDLAPLSPLTRHGLRIVLLLVIITGTTVIPALVGADLSGSEVTFFLLSNLWNLPLAVAAFLLPVRGLRRHIRARKAEELARVREDIRIDHNLVAQRGSDSAEASARLPGQLAYMNQIESVREWPFDAPTLTRFFLYVAIPLGSWVGGALVERLLGAALD
jgi:hypothetical protein